MHDVELVEYFVLAERVRTTLVACLHGRMKAVQSMGTAVRTGFCRAMDVV